MTKKIFYIIIFFCFLSGCGIDSLPITNSNLSGYWIAGAWEVDKGIFMPQTEFMEIKQDGRIKYLKNFSQDTFLSYTIKSDSVVFPYMTLPIQAIKRHKKTLEIGQTYPMHYLKVEKSSVELDSTQIRDKLIAKNWVSKNEVLDFEMDSIIVYKSNLKNKEKLCWKILDLEGHKILQKRGNFMECESPERFMEHISLFDEERMVIERWEEGAFRTIVYKSSNASPPNFNYEEFSLCNPYTYRFSTLNRYNFRIANYEGGLYKLKQIFDKDFNKVDIGKIDGIVKIGFMVNCRGDIGEFDILELDYDYKKIKLNDNISAQLLKILKSTGNWNPGVGRNGEVDSYKFLYFKIKDGRISEIFP